MFGKGIPKKVTISLITKNREMNIVIPRKRFKETFGMKNPTDAILIEYCENILKDFPNVLDYELKRE